MFTDFRLAAFAFALFTSSLLAEDEMPKVLRFSSPIVSVSAVQGKPSMGAELKVENTGGTDFAFSPVITGKDAAAFIVEPKEAVIGPGGAESFRIKLSPIRGEGVYQAELDVVEGVIRLKGVGLKAFEGNNEPPLARIVNALGMQLDVGGEDLRLDTAADTIGASLAATRFRGIKGLPVRVSTVARFSPPGEVPFGIVMKSGKSIEWGKLDRSDKSRPDNHQCLFPSMNDGLLSIEKKAPNDAFAFFMKGHIFVSYTDPRLNSGAPVKHTARIWPVEKLQGREMENAYLVGFEEAKNGDYQDAVFLLENVIAE